MENQNNFKVSDKVRKKKGYTYNGIIVSIFTTLTGKERCVVEIDGTGNCAGMLHIFALTDLELQ